MSRAIYNVICTFWLVFLGLAVANPTEYRDLKARSQKDIQEAANEGDLAAVKAAIARGADKDTTKTIQPLIFMGPVGFDKEGWFTDAGFVKCTPLMYAVMGRHPDVVQYLLEIGADPNVVNYTGLTALMYAILDKEDVKLVECFTSYPEALAFKEPRFGMTPLMWAVIHGDRAVVKLLLEKIGDPNVQDNDGWTALHYAANLNREECIGLLILKNADVNAADKGGMTPLMRASAKGHEEAVERLLRSGAKRDILSKEGRSALDYAKAKLGLGGLRIEKIDQDTVRILEGFVYSRNMVAPEPQTLRVVDIKKGGGMEATGTLTMGYQSAVGTTWIFDKAGIVLENGGYVYTSKVKDATIELTKDGAVLRGFSIENPNEEHIKRVLEYLTKAPDNEAVIR